jgi:DnaJ-class molecular chaperone
MKYKTENLKCHSCHGKGYILHYDHKCGKCSGSGYLEKKTAMPFKVSGKLVLVIAVVAIAIAWWLSF